MAAVVSTVLLGGCASNPISSSKTVSVGESEVPKWFMNVPEDTETKIYAVGTGLSDDLQFAYEKAIHSAKTSLADKMASRSSAEMKSFISDNGKGAQGITTQKTTKVSKSSFIDIDVSRYIIVENKTQREDNIFRVYIQLSLDPTNRIKNDTVNTFSAQDNAEADNALNNL